MKKILLSLSMLTSVAMAQTMFPAGPISPKGWVHPMAEDKIVKDGTTQQGAFMSSHENEGAEIEYSEDGNSLKIDKKDEGGLFASVSFSPFHAGETSATEATLNISEEAVIYMKMKGSLGDVVTLNLKDDKFNSIMEYEEGVINDWDDEAYNEVIACEDYRWYKFDYSAKSNLTKIKSVEIIINNGKSWSTTVWIDSLIVGKTNITPTIPQDPSELKWDVSFDAPWFTSADPNGTPVDDNVMVLDTGVAYNVTIASTSGSDKGAQFTLNDGSNNVMLDITASPYVKTSIKGSVGDTIRVNLLTGSAFKFIDTYVIHEFTTNEYEEVMFDFSSVSTQLEEVVMVEFILNPSSTVDGTFSINALTVGDHMASGCEADVSVGFSNSINEDVVNIYPNPTSSSFVSFSAELTNITVFDAQGVERLSALKAEALNLTGLESGMYLIHSTEGTFKLIVE